MQKCQHHFLPLLNSTLHLGSCGLSEGLVCVAACGLHQWDWRSWLNQTSFISVADLFCPGSVLLDPWTANPPPPQTHTPLSPCSFAPACSKNCQMSSICILITLAKRSRTSALQWMHNVKRYQIFCLNSSTILYWFFFCSVLFYFYKLVIFQLIIYRKFNCSVFCDSLKKSKEEKGNTLP